MLTVTAPPEQAHAAPHAQRWEATGLRGLVGSVLGTLARMDDDPVLFCECADGDRHTCGD